jgi:hypothetical protein
MSSAPSAVELPLTSRQSPLCWAFTSYTTGGGGGRGLPLLAGGRTADLLDDLGPGGGDAAGHGQALAAVPGPQVHGQGAAGHSGSAEEESGQLGAAGAGQPSQADDLAGPQVQVDVVQD